MATPKEIIEVAGREVAVSNPEKVYLPRSAYTKHDLVRYYIAVAEGALRGAGGQPMALKRDVNGAEGEFFLARVWRAGREASSAASRSGTSNFGVLVEVAIAIQSERHRRSRSRHVGRPPTQESVKKAQVTRCRRRSLDARSPIAGD